MPGYKIQNCLEYITYPMFTLIIIKFFENLDENSIFVIDLGCTKSLGKTIKQDVS